MMQQIIDLARTSCQAAVAELTIEAEANFTYQSVRGDFPEDPSLALDGPPSAVEAAITEPSTVGAPAWVQSLATIPVTGPSAETGWLTVASENADAFDAKTLTSLASAKALIEARLDRTAEMVRFDAISTLLRENQEVLQGTRDRLEVSNRELEQFAYIAAHELVAPLRAVAAYAEILGGLVDSSDEVLAPVEECVTHIRDGVTLMNRQVRSLLALSRAETDTANLESVDLGFVVEQALDTLSRPLEEIGADVTVGPLPKVMASVVPLQSVFANLISNAIRYRDPSRVLAISVQSEQVADAWKVTVSDNGLGIKTEDHARVFQLFERASADTDGSGIGLALSRRILEAFGASISVEPSSSEGSTFVLLFPGSALKAS